MFRVRPRFVKLADVSNERISSMTMHFARNVAHGGPYALLEPAWSTHISHAEVVERRA